MKMEIYVWITIESMRTVYKKNSKKETTLENETSSLPFFIFKHFYFRGRFPVDIWVPSFIFEIACIMYEHIPPS